MVYNWILFVNLLAFTEKAAKEMGYDPGYVWVMLNSVLNAYNQGYEEGYASIFN